MLVTERAMNLLSNDESFASSDFAVSAMLARDKTNRLKRVLLAR